MRKRQSTAIQARSAVSSLAPPRRSQRCPTAGSSPRARPATPAFVRWGGSSPTPATAPGRSASSPMAVRARRPTSAAPPRSRSSFSTATTLVTLSGLAKLSEGESEARPRWRSATIATLPTRKQDRANAAFVRSRRGSHGAIDPRRHAGTVWIAGDDAERDATGVWRLISHRRSRRGVIGCRQRHAYAFGAACVHAIGAACKGARPRSA